MSRRSRADGEPVKTRRRKTVRPKRRNAQKAVHRGSSRAVDQETKVARLTRELQTSEERWRSLLENPIFGVTFLDEHQRFISSNQAYQTMTGYSDEELCQLTPLDISVPGEREFNETLFRELQQGKRQHYEMIKQLRCKDGKLIWIHLYVFAIPDRKSGGLLTFGIAFDITEKKQAQDALQNTRAELARLGRMNQMVAVTGSIAHEINQPLAAILANANAGLRWLARTTPDVGETRTVLRGIVHDAHRAGEVIQGIRATFKAEGQTRVSVDLNALMREALALTQGELQKERIVVQTELTGKLPPVTADRVQLQEVMLNLITNAIDAMGSVTDRKRLLRVKTELNGSEGAFITVEDSGTGIAPGNIDRIFDTFFTTKPNGMGIGLAICRSIVESHGGSLSASPSYPHGAVFQIVLPIGRSGSE
jgi:PAS domain S-box-containing protein